MLRLCDGLVDLDRIQRLRLAIEEGRKEMREVLLFILRAYNKQQTKKKKNNYYGPIRNAQILLKRSATLYAWEAFAA